MMIKLESNTYGKHAVNLSKIIRHADYNEFRHISVHIDLEGDFETAYTEGNNKLILATDTQKNLVYILAKEHFTSTIEAFGIFLAEYFCHHYKQISQSTINITEHSYSRMTFNGVQHADTYISNGSEKHTTTIVKNEWHVQVSAGISDLLIVKTAHSGFEDYLKTPHTTLKETSDRILATQCEAEWLYTAELHDYSALFSNIRNALLKSFADHRSLSVQHTLYAMGKDVLEQYAAIKQISLKMPNKHHIPFNLEQFGLSNNNEIFIATDEPFGYITGTVVRE